MNCIKNSILRTGTLSICLLTLLLVITFQTTLDIHAQESDHTLWSADHEIYDDDGDCDTSLNREYEIVDDATGISSYDPNILRQWEVGQVGRVSFNTPDFSEQNSEEATVSASDRHARSGRCSLKMTVRNADRDSIRAVRVFKRWLDFDNLPNGYYSAWYYTPEIYQTENFWNVFQFKSQYPNIVDGNLREGNASDSMFSFNLESVPSGSSNPTHYNLYVNHKFPKRDHVDSCEVDSDDSERCADQQYYDLGFRENSGPVKIPPNSWFQIKAYFVQSGSTVTQRENSTAVDGKIQSNGILKVWVTLSSNGSITERLVISQENIPTLTFPEAISKWSINNYSTYMPDSNITLYTDDAKISSCDGLYQESEDAQRRGDFRIGSSSKASGGKYLYVPIDETSVDDATRLAYCFRVNRSGTYRLKGWAVGPSGGSDSLYIATEDDPDNRYYWSVPIGSDFEGKYVVDGYSGDYIDLSLDRGEHRLFVYPRETGAKVDRLALERIETEPPAEDDCGPMSQQAEDGDLSGNFALGDDENASGDQYIYATATSETGGPDPENRARFCFTVPQAGTYYIQGWVYAANASSNSLYVTVNDLPAAGYKWHTIDFSNQDEVSYRADYVIDQIAENYVALNLDAGPQVVTFYPREKGIRLDKVKLVSVSASSLMAASTENTVLGFVRDTEQTSYKLYLPFSMNTP